ncbi:MAG: peptidyl-prolyl cis-trans isomerase, partial [Candidatus Aminicenantes bacterium]|nr:peptidyl-prolyl cis-trans isomerase [Candidatus Aminicenantes bacterium]
IKVTDNEAYKYYKEHPNEFYRPERVKVHQILLDSEDKALLIREKLKNASHNEFEKLAKQYSTAPESKKGGDMGWYEKGDLPSDMENVIFSLNPGQVSQVVKTALGYHIFRLDRKEKARMLTFPEVRDRIKRKLLEEKRDKALNDWLTKLKHEYKVKIYEENLGFPYSKEE